MSNVDATAETVPLTREPPGVMLRWFERCESSLTRIGDHLNPILVKEARQALKSRQFTITFILVLAAGWCWSIMGIAWMGPGVYWASDGPSMFFGYYLILAFPLTVIVPYSAFRSLASEREDRTYELLSITTLRARQVVSGKLAGAVLQMVVYLSAISPCLAFTYLLRGLDVLTITTIIVYLFLGSLGLSMLCILLATATTEKYQHVVVSVGVVFGLGYACLGACIAAGVLLTEGASFDLKEFWIANAAMLTAYLSYFVLFFLAAAAQLAFVGSNRSTMLRVVGVVQQALFLAWMGGIWYAEEIRDRDFPLVVALALGLHWYAMGIFMTGEPHELSPRVKRDLPQSFLGRAFLTWLNPGPASGYMLAISSFLAGAVLILLACSPLIGWAYEGRRFDSTLLLCVICLSYLAIYLGLGRMIMGWLSRWTSITIASRVLVHVLMLFVVTVVPLTIQMTLPGLRYEGYTLLQLSNPFWTLAEAVDYTPTADLYSVAAVLSVLGLIVFCLNLPAVAEEVRQVRIAVPSRVAEEDAALAAANAPSEPVKTNPWD